MSPSSAPANPAAASSKRPASALPLVSVIVPVRNEEPFLRGTLRQLLEQHYDPERFEVVVADGRSTDGTAAVVRDLVVRYPNLRLLDNPARLSSAGRNQAIRAARGEILVIVDGHCDLDSRGYLRDLVEAFARSRADCIGRPQPLDVAGATPLQRAIAAARSSWLGHHPSSFIYSNAEQFVSPHSVAVAYRREVFEAVGLFDESFDACEDVEFNHRVARAGFRCFLTPRVRVRYHPRSSLDGLCRQMFRYGRGRVRLLRKHRETFSVLGFLPAAFVLSVVLGAGLSWFSPWIAAPYAAGLLLYAAVVGLVSAALGVRGGNAWVALSLPPVFFSIHFGAGMGILWEAVSGACSRPRSVSIPFLPGRGPSAETIGARRAA
jgi:succinoglycan biosynthesis protein ExoA